MATNGTQNGTQDGTTAEGPSVPISVALSPNNASSVPDLSEKIHSLVKSYKPAEDSHATRLELLANARSLVQALETPRETMIKHNWAQPTAHQAIAVGVDIGLWQKMLENDSPKSVNDLAPVLGINANVLARLMRHLAAMGYLVETAPDVYQSTNFSKSLTIPVIGDGYPCLAGGSHTAQSRFREWAKEKGWPEPSSVSDGPYQKAYDTELNFFQYLHANQPLGVQFNHHMGGYRQGRPSWMDEGFFPVENRLVKGADNEAPLLIDVGGGLGHDIDEFRRKHPNVEGRLVVQDLPNVLEEITDLDAKIERVPYDFFTPQPIHGARAYYMHSVLHDWPDDTCLQILNNIKPAMKPGYSKLLINENVIPDTAAHWEATALDLMMMTLLSAKERTEKQWKHLIEDMAGLRIVRIWTVGNGVEGLIECELP